LNNNKPILKPCTSISKLFDIGTCYQRFKLWYKRLFDIEAFLASTISTLVIQISKVLHSIWNKSLIPKNLIMNKPLISGVARFQMRRLRAGQVELFIFLLALISGDSDPRHILALATRIGSTPLNLKLPVLHHAWWTLKMKIM
jgi:hypothetical protein